MMTRLIGRTLNFILLGIVRAFAATGISPNILTFIGFSVTLLGAYLFAYGYFRWAGLAVVLAGLFDMLDGRVARLSNQVTPFGGFLDSVLDRYSDLCLMIGLLLFYGRANRSWYVVLVAVAMIGSVMTSYARARAENLISTCKVGFLERPERMVLIIIGALFDRMAPVMWIIAVLSTWTVVHRVVYTWQESRRQALSPPPGQHAPSPTQ